MARLAEPTCVLPKSAHWRLERCAKNRPAGAPLPAAPRFFVAAVAAVPVGRYETRWSDEWRVLDLIGHGNRANLLPVEYYERPAPLAGPDYMSPENIVDRERLAVRGLG